MHVVILACEMPEWDRQQLLHGEYELDMIGRSGVGELRQACIVTHCGIVTHIVTHN